MRGRETEIKQKMREIKKGKREEKMKQRRKRGRDRDKAGERDRDRDRESQSYVILLSDTRRIIIVIILWGQNPSSFNIHQTFFLPLSSVNYFQPKQKPTDNTDKEQI